jgi:hypothetical protein
MIGDPSSVFAKWRSGLVGWRRTERRESQTEPHVPLRL